jgi:hypothetical protein
MSNHVETLFAAVSVLSGNGNIKQRLMTAYADYLDDIDAEELPLVVHQAFADLRRSITRVEPMNGEGPICATVRKMSIEEAEDCARSIVRLYGDIIRYSHNVQEMLPLQIAGSSVVQPIVPPFLVKSRVRSGHR